MTEKEIQENDPLAELESEPDYDPGYLNDYGGGNVEWWFDYIRSEINRCNEYWRERYRAAIGGDD